MDKAKMTSERISASTLDAILALQMTIAWAGEGLCEPKRLDWWRTDVVDAAGGGDLFKRLCPKTHQWAALEAVRSAAIQTDRRERLKLAKPDALRTLFFWGANVDEQLSDRLAEHKRNAISQMPSEVLPLSIFLQKGFSSRGFANANELGASFDRAAFEALLSISDRIETKIVPGGRLLVTDGTEDLDIKAKKLVAALLPLADNYPTPMYRIGEH
jgi:hypothetical protein